MRTKEAPASLRSTIKHLKIVGKSLKNLEDIINFDDYNDERNGEEVNAGPPELGPQDQPVQEQQMIIMNVTIGCCCRRNLYSYNQERCVLLCQKNIMVPPKWPNVLEVFVYSSTKSAGNGRAVDTAPA